MEVGGPGLPLAAVDLRRVGERPAVVRDEGGVEGDDARGAADGPGQVAGQGGPDPAVEAVRVVELAGEVAEDGVPVGCPDQPEAGVGDRGGPGGGVGEDGGGGTPAGVGPPAQDRAEEVGEELLDLGGGEDMLGGRMADSVQEKGCNLFLGAAMRRLHTGRPYRNY